MTIRRALLSAYDKTGLVDFARGLHGLGVELVASGGTAAALEGGEVPVTPVETLTGFAEMLGHRVVTLHPAIHGGILARRDVPEDAADLARHGIAPIDLVCVNLYPFEQTVARLAVSDGEAIERIDVGGPALLRGAAKNHRHVVALCRPTDYEPVLEELQATGSVSLETRRQLAAHAFAATAAYDAAIARWLDDDGLPETLVLAFDRERRLAYGENPHQQGAFYVERGQRTHLLAQTTQAHGPALSYNNLHDLETARTLVDRFERPGCVVVKHASPCGAAVADTIDKAFAKAWASDPISAYGGVIALNRPIGAALGEELAARFVEVVYAPGIDAEALATLVAKERLRVLIGHERRAAPSEERDLRRVRGGLLVQERDLAPDPVEEMRVACGSLPAGGTDDVAFAWAVVRHIPSNAIVVVRDGQVLGVGGGQPSRVDAVQLALTKAQAHGHVLTGATLASDAFFPFADGPLLALEAGIATIVQPGGSKRDVEVEAAIRAAGATLVLTGRRHFRH